MKRIITYLYEYHNGKKGNNIGFLKVDLRGTECRVQLHIQAPGKETEKGNVYLVAKNSPAEGVMLGEIMMEQGRCETTWRFSRLRIQGSSYELSQIMGAGIMFPSGRYFASSWVEEPAEELLRGTFRIWKESEENGRAPRSIPLSQKKKEQPQSLQPTANVIPMQDAIQMKHPRNQFWSIHHPEETPSEDTALSDANVHNVTELRPETKFEPETETDLPNESDISGAAEINTAEPQTTEDNPAEEQKAVDIMPADTQAASNPETVQKDVDIVPVDSQDMDNPATMPSDEIRTGKTQMIAENIIPLDKNVQDSKDTPAIDDKSGCMKRIDINYIKKLPKRNWYLCNNSFLIHGFFNYHYLVLKEVEENGMKKLYLGVPGIFEKPERAMALLFGFPEFAAAQPENGVDVRPQEGRVLRMPREENASGEVQDGTFGYWFCLLDT